MIHQTFCVIFCRNFDIFDGSSNFGMPQNTLNKFKSPPAKYILVAPDRLAVWVYYCHQVEHAEEFFKYTESRRELFAEAFTQAIIRLPGSYPTIIIPVETPSITGRSRSPFFFIQTPVLPYCFLIPEQTKEMPVFIK
jgi:hypothetical protein